MEIERNVLRDDLENLNLRYGNLIKTQMKDEAEMDILRKDTDDKDVEILQVEKEEKDLEIARLREENRTLKLRCGVEEEEGAVEEEEGEEEAVEEEEGEEQAEEEGLWRKRRGLWRKRRGLWRKRWGLWRKGRGLWMKRRGCGGRGEKDGEIDALLKENQELTEPKEGCEEVKDDMEIERNVLRDDLENLNLRYGNLIRRR
ncbi:hypothetical protein F7725_001736 [Dissostichus mawsoni]|uniref:Uncharacterized protein n=1 Tax=Dissostichus mawsoni TaxID=36200 RepID=A0A7J5Y2I5_DISMA|nr:hypothetical protein F7725_001736 [Dissostichus mawsoni]